MKLTVTNAALEKLQDKLVDGVDVYLDFIDGDSPGYEGAISCTLAVAYRLLIVSTDKKLKAFDLYQTKVESNMGNIGIKESSIRYLEEEMTLDFNASLFRFQLKGNSGILSENVLIESM
ncbi:iron-sulfur cluster biosynthesis family protein [Vagococcus xieshaowenii]|uniref:Iron-sulfur cluster biosynthesis family protein n=1 Tax=Vagococcus xieshaowenii TaxID=2562451 RepID=A0A4Z0D3L4_9ENTE|nr:iron-sulfur cluster biosynthesis family protein [Vagococcus xieshaowenii]QCA28124.1 iron-sulfur cluster biosynthesis family protein [Vagococcus xieshaowenii]TFZ40167.1 iron-sulfur cluster biosynthesis family protein [Vagococcus xieshaowenii]